MPALSDTFRDQHSRLESVSAKGQWFLRRNVAEMSLLQSRSNVAVLSQTFVKSAVLTRSTPQIQNDGHAVVHGAETRLLLIPLSPANFCCSVCSTPICIHTSPNTGVLTLAKIIDPEGSISTDSPLIYILKFLYFD